jgi:hypothetical protein
LRIKGVLTVGGRRVEVVVARRASNDKIAEEPTRRRKSRSLSQRTKPLDPRYSDLVEKGAAMEVPGKVSLYCPLIDASGTVAKLIAVMPQGYYHLEVSIKGQTHTMFVPIANSALYFAEPEEAADPEQSFEIER